MTDLALFWSNDDFAADVKIDAGKLLTDDGLRTAIIISLFTDARAANDDVLPEAGTDRRGYWGDIASPVAGWEMGSKLWLLAREKQRPSVLARARDYAQAALAWMVEDQVASSVVATATFPTRSALGITIEITRPDGPQRERYDFAWNATEQQLRAV